MARTNSAAEEHKVEQVISLIVCRFVYCSFNTNIFIMLISLYQTYILKNNCSELSRRPVSFTDKVSLQQIIVKATAE